MKKKNAIDRAVEKSMEKDMPCVLCGQATGHRGVFMPNTPKDSLLGPPPPGKTRMVIYALCEKHPQDDATAKAVETALEKIHLSSN